jgi:hypothetical protein
MANAFTYQVLRDTTQKTVIKFTGFFDGLSGDESNGARIQANTLYGALDSSKANLLASAANTGPLPYYGLSVEKIWFEANFQGTGHARLYWTSGSAANTKTIIGISGQGVGTYNDNGNWITIPNNAEGTAGCNGDIGITTFGANVANSTYNVIVELRKDNQHYQRGQLNDPASFNYPGSGSNNYGPRP